MLYGVKNPHGGDRYGDGIALDFSANVSPLGTPKCVTEAIERSLPELYRYPDPYCRAWLSFRRALGKDAFTAISRTSSLRKPPKGNIRRDTCK